MTLGAEVGAGKPAPLFKVNIARGAVGSLGNLSRHEYDVMPDGQRFIINVPPQTSDIPITVLVNWPSMLKKQSK